MTIGKFAVCTLSALRGRGPAGHRGRGAGGQSGARHRLPPRLLRRPAARAGPSAWPWCGPRCRPCGAWPRGATPAGYSPAELQSAYNLALASAAAGRGETVAVVDAYDDPDAAADLAIYRAHYGLPACGSGCFSQVNQEGQASPLPAASGQHRLGHRGVAGPRHGVGDLPELPHPAGGGETAPSPTWAQAVNAAVALGARFVSNSYSAAEFAGETAADSAYYDHPGVAVTAAAGDSGYGVGYPAASGYVTSVGGTALTRDPAAARGWSETAWNSGSGATGSGCSAYEPKPSWQADAGCSHRTDNDVAADADPDTGAAIYDSYDQGGWLEVGGTSEATPDHRRDLRPGRPASAGSDPAEYPYQHTAALDDVTSGSDGSCGGSYLCTARPGYDGPTGWGTPDGTGAFQAVDHSVTVASPGNRHSRAGKKSTPLAIAARDSGSAQPLRFTASGLPAGLSISPGGVISGTPKARGYYAVRVYATDATGMTGSASFRWPWSRPAPSRSLGKCLDDWHGGTANGNKIDDLPVQRRPGPGLAGLSPARRRAADPAGQGGPACA